MPGRFLLDDRQCTIIAMALNAVRADMYGLIEEHQQTMNGLLDAEKNGEVLALLYNLRTQYKDQIEAM